MTDGCNMDNSNQNLERIVKFDPSWRSIYTNNEEAYRILLQEGTQPEFIPQDWIQDRQPQANGELFGDKDLVELQNQDWRTPDNTSVVKIEEKAVNAADHFFEASRQQTGFVSMRDDHLDCPVFSNITPEEAEVGQYVGHFNTSQEFDCDGNSYTSLTDNSME
eukprot:CAMPEP_0205799908 /NCGR_PEP_ID=MMETSP0205-20121125/1388_1 /ASSEMBLY_ACC=CAM_ASM_000278 /TAXON_ID=36767 /ORGANISM="Euplotes focardii, Strain TN1" /LENGTH=162 /DNA_ID=CAMNT_0053062109 /DNA_START=242 /DNA_END=731 /DNA_ORIENTATION=-